MGYRQDTVFALLHPGMSITSVVGNTVAATRLGYDSNGVAYPQADRICAVSLYDAQDCWVEINQVAAANTGLFIKGAAAPIVVAAKAGDQVNVIRDTVDGSLKVKPLSFLAG